MGSSGCKLLKLYRLSTFVSDSQRHEAADVLDSDMTRGATSDIYAINGTAGAKDASKRRIEAAMATVQLQPPVHGAIGVAGVDAMGSPAS